MSKENEQIKELQDRVHNLEQALSDLIGIVAAHLESSAQAVNGMIDIEEGK